MKLFRKGFNYSQDGPGNRLVYHLHGCNFSCIWCANPEGMGPDFSNCFDRSVEDLFDEAMRCRKLFFDGGGVTLTGGEPTCQFAETALLLRRLHRAGIHTAIETNGSHPHLAELLHVIDYLMMDFKHFDNEVHQRWTGAQNTVVRRNLEHICRMGREALIRIPLINGFNTDPEGFVSYFRGLDTAGLSFEFLPYHEYGKEKWKEPYLVKDGFVSQEGIDRFWEVFQKNQLRVVTT